MLYFYDVCNDYSLVITEKPSDLSEYKQSERVSNSGDGSIATLFIHKKHNELHYIQADKALI